MCFAAAAADKPSEGPLLADYREHHTDVSVHFDIDLVPGKLTSITATAGGLETKFKLNSKISTGVITRHTLALASEHAAVNKAATVAL